MMAEFPRGEAGALIARTSLIDPDMHRDTRIVCAINWCRRGSPVDGRQPTCVAMGQYIDHRTALRFGCGPKKIDAMRADTFIDSHILVADFRGTLKGGIATVLHRKRPKNGTHPIQGPTQIDGSGARRGKRFAGAVERVVTAICLHGKRDTIGRRRANQRRTAHLHGLNRVSRFANRG